MLNSLQNKINVSFRSTRIQNLPQAIVKNDHLLSFQGKGKSKDTDYVPPETYRANFAPHLGSKALHNEVFTAPVDNIIEKFDLETHRIWDLAVKSAKDNNSQEINTTHLLKGIVQHTIEEREHFTTGSNFIGTIANKFLPLFQSETTRNSLTNAIIDFDEMLSLEIKDTPKTTDGVIEISQDLQNFLMNVGNNKESIGAKDLLVQILKNKNSNEYLFLNDFFNKLEVLNNSRTSEDIILEKLPSPSRFNN